MRILVTGFEPFEGENMNSSWEAVKRLSEEIAGNQIWKCQLPVSFNQCEEILIQKLEEIRPDLVLCTGLAGGRKGITVERIGINIRDARIPDNGGEQPVDCPIRQGGPVAYFATLPIKAIVKELNENQIPAAISNTAGTYVCNDIFYTLLDWQARNIPEAKGGFIHLPYTLEQANTHTEILRARVGCTPGEFRESVFGMSLEKMTQALELAICVCVKEGM
ncbi:MAG: pyroglutamyl-peptidase I [Lachnospiraceae bacterium]|nr:pyroglutamyl-peptidase I [Lachnospiraceae bacterium]